MDRSSRASSDQERLSETVKAVRGGTASRIASSAVLVRLASDLGISPQDLALRLSDDTIRRTKYPVHEQRQPDGRIIYVHPVMAPDA